MLPSFTLTRITEMSLWSKGRNSLNPAFRIVVCLPLILVAIDEGLAAAQAREGAGAACVRLAASPEDTQRRAPDVSLEALAACKAAADGGLVDAMRVMGTLYERGIPVQDYGEAARYYGRAAAAGDPRSMNLMGVLHEVGRGVAKNQSTAATWYRRAADAGNTAGMRNIGRLHQFGWGVLKDEREAMKWYRRAADAGNTQAMSDLASLLSYGPPSVRNESVGAEWFRKAAGDGNARAMIGLGVAYQKGAGVSLDPAEAVKWFKAATYAGDEWGKLLVAEAYERGLGVPRDPNTARLFYADLTLSTDPELARAAGKRWSDLDGASRRSGSLTAADLILGGLAIIVGAAILAPSGDSSSPSNTTGLPQRDSLENRQEKRRRDCEFWFEGKAPCF
jgi:TPR repeat protein